MMKEVYQYIEPYPINFNWQLDIEKRKYWAIRVKKPNAHSEDATMLRGLHLKFQ